MSGTPLDACSKCGVPIAEHPLTDACAIAQETRAHPRQEDFERVLAEGLDTAFVADIIEPLESGEIQLIARHLAIRCALLVRDFRAAAEAAP